MKFLYLILLIFSVGCAKSKSSDDITTAKVHYCLRNIPADFKTEFNSNTVNDLQIFGDSHARGYSSCDELAPNNIATGFASVLAEKLNMPLDLKAIGGTEITSQLVEIKKYGQRRTSVKLLVAGFNDAWFKTDINVFKASLTEALTIMSQNADLVILATPPPYDASFVNDCAPYAQAVREVFQETNFSNVRLSDLYTRINTDSSILNKDMIHFNKLGSEEISNILLENF